MSLPARTESVNHVVDDKAKKVAIIGAGISGLITASVLKEEGHNVTIFEMHSTPGGVWRHAAYPGARLQNLSFQYCHPDLSWSEAKMEVDDHATAEQICDYIDHAIVHFELKDCLKLHTKIVRCDQRKDNRWTVVARNLTTEQETVEEYDFVLVAQGHYSQDKSEHLPWGDREVFEKAGGKVYTRQTFGEAGFEALNNKRVAVIGFGKTAVDMCEFVPEKSKASQVHHVFRTPRWLIPTPILGLHFTWFLMNRFNVEMVPSWDYPSQSMRRFHRGLTGVVNGFWAFLEVFFWNGIFYGPRALFASKEARERLQALRPSQKLVKDHRSAFAICPSRYFDKIKSGVVKPHRSGVEKFTEMGLLLSNKEELEVDAILVCTGNGSTASKFPYLKRQGQDIDFGINHTDRGLQLYRHLIHPEIPNLGFCGFNHGFIHCSHVYLGAIWMSCWMRDEVALPSVEEQQASVQRIMAWKRQNATYEPTLNEGVNTRMLYYNEIMMMDFGLNPLRKSNPIREQFERYGACDYAGVLKEVQAKRANSLAKGEEFRLVPVDRDM